MPQGLTATPTHAIPIQGGADVRRQSRASPRTASGQTIDRGTAAYLFAAMGKTSTEHTIGRMMLAGLRVPDHDVLELARGLRDAELDATAEKLERAYDNDVVVLALTIADREAILRALRRCRERGAGGRAELAAESRRPAEAGPLLLRQCDYFFGFGKNVASHSRSSAVSIR